MSVLNTDPTAVEGAVKNFMMNMVLTWMDPVYLILETLSCMI